MDVRPKTRSKHLSTTRNFGIPDALREHILRECWLVHERLKDAPAKPGSMPCDGLAEWQNALNPNIPSKLTDRLKWNGSTIEQGLWALNPPQNAGIGQPSWFPVLEEICAATHSSGDSLFSSEFRNELGSLPERSTPLPFQDVWFPAILVARRHLVARVGRNKYLTDDAIEDLERGLLRGLCDVSFHALMEAYNSYRPVGMQALASLIGDDPSDRSDEFYRAFIREVSDDGLCQVLQNFPILGRMVATVVLQWIDCTAEFLERVERDWPELQKRLQTQEDPKYITQVQTGLSDPHRGGRTVLIAVFETGQRIVYKPKDLSLEVAYQKFLVWCNDHLSLRRPFKTLFVLKREDYGWMEFVEFQPSSTPEQWQVFYEQAGALLCILYLLGASDCHFENLIASGEHLVLVDTETLLQSPLREADRDAPDRAYSKLEQAFGESVNRTGILPHWQYFKATQATVDISGLGNSLPPKSLKDKVLQNVNTDLMGWSIGEAVIKPRLNLPFAEHDSVELQDYADDILKGFAHTYQQLHAQKSRLNTANGPLQKFENCHVRFVFRNTRIYSAILDQCRSAKALTNAKEYNLHLEKAAKAFLTEKEKPFTWPILSVEEREIAALNVPVFEYVSNSVDLILPDNESLRGAFETSGFQDLLNRCERLSNTDLEFQTAIIRGTLSSQNRELARPSETVTDGGESEIPGHVTQRELIGEAEQIADQLVNKAVLDKNGDFGWLSFNYLSESDQWHFAPMGMGLFDGRCGPILFFSALAHVTGQSKYAEYANRALRPLASDILGARFDGLGRYFRNNGTGIVGAGGILYTLACLDQWQTEVDCDISELSNHIASSLSRDVISQDDELDIIGGSAGCILGLLAMYHQTAEALWLKLASDIGQHLTDHQDQASGGWTTFAPRPLTGFSHGAAGTAYALLSLFSETEHLGFRDAGLRAIRYENDQFDRTQNNWPDFRHSAEAPPFLKQWCNGSAGIGLGRIGCIGVVKDLDDYLTIDIDRAAATIEPEIAVLDSLCCGNLGRIELLLSAAEKLGQPELTSRAHMLAGKVVHRARQRGHYGLLQLAGKPLLNPGFFQGASGVGYELLRLAVPRKLPNVALLERPV
ncbi:type 2 lanthipeptide synthetase LanM family protein [Ruegeria arenilitoris]|uniref:type 2 lanthipeptide synthetase LanM family protein n=1 Tax=Ruegeria arenilitoris TaxID=1173585 RepID=UPI00147E7223|nr:type 2 lanthipeptide synthetase LanM family protein [Ruegeria arenilitoris]